MCRFIGFLFSPSEEKDEGCNRRLPGNEHEEQIRTRTEKGGGAENETKKKNTQKWATVAEEMKNDVIRP